MLTLIRWYRAWPYRPHCASAVGVHAWPCRVVSGVLHWSNDCYKRPDAGVGCPNPSREWVADNTRCPAKDA